MTTRPNRPTDGREFVRMSVDIAHHPKIVDLGDPAAAWGYATAMAYAGKYHTDGWITLKTIAHEAGISTQKARKLVQVGLVHETGHACEKCPEIPKGQAYIHDYLEHNRSKSDVDEQRRSKAAAGKRGAEKRWAGTPKTTPKNTPVSHGTTHGSTHSTTHGTNMAEVEVEKELTPPTQAPHLRNAPEIDDQPTGPGITGSNSSIAYRLVDQAIGRNQPSTIRTALAIEVAGLLREIDQALIVEALQRWNTRTGIGPKILPSLVADLVKEQTGTGGAEGATQRAGAHSGLQRPPSGRGAKARGWLELGADSGPQIGSDGSSGDAQFHLITGGMSA